MDGMSMTEMMSVHNSFLPKKLYRAMMYAETVVKKMLDTVPSTVNIRLFRNIAGKLYSINVST